jgi:uncharacterized protein YuzE
MPANSFQVSVSHDETTGKLLAVYFRVRKGQSAKTVEHADGAAFADYDRRGNLLGIELLEPCSISVLDLIAEKPPVKKFIRESIPRHMELVGS